MVKKKKKSVRWKFSHLGTFKRGVSIKGNQLLSHIFKVFKVLSSTLLHLPPLRFHCVVTEDAEIESMTIVTLALAVRRSNLSVRSHSLQYCISPFFFLYYFQVQFLFRKIFTLSDVKDLMVSLRFSTRVRRGQQEQRVFRNALHQREVRPPR